MLDFPSSEGQESRLQLMDPAAVRDGPARLGTEGTVTVEQRF